MYQSGVGFYSNESAAFQMLGTATNVPEPTSVTLLQVGMIDADFMARRRRQSTTTPTACWPQNALPVTRRISGRRLFA
jgi:hypothetical protein